ncbi:DUF3298 and DUF4163 domain-containing protein [Caldibacillus lycopersici]|uniref:DUF3298 and DUF4163 domain-containing protein n=1 Tax=Perspicuibacillus lycopersici TaxID=1325689 RepID=A0AAE3IU04_9BACI|nr:DUF3298 and DUF4163 domain-containing protein [Perspicuibacillus lycopersici]MCU9614600.1 DUF3298 and DUF4163 domain-containing protein [Perspicuibacillus lycopersici]
MPTSLPVIIQPLKITSGPKKTIYYPLVSGMKNQHFENLVNQTIVQHTQQLINLQVGDIPSTVEEMIGSFEIKNNQRDVLSLYLSNYTYHYHAAHGMTFIHSLTFDLKDNKICTLQSLFKPGSNYIERLSELIHLQIKERNIELIDDFTVIKPDQDFYLADKTLVIYFQLYDITPYVFGFPMFPINVYSIQDLIDENGPLGRLAANN